MEYEFEDKIMKKLAMLVYTKLGPITPPQALQPDEYFNDIAETIVGQQLSTKVAPQIIQKVKKILKVESFIPESILKADTELLRSGGISYSKVSYIKNLAESWQNKSIKYKDFTRMEDEEVIAQLTTVKGIGRWTAEMFLMFGLARPDIFSAGDYGLKVAAIKAYKLHQNVKPAELMELSKAWSPQRTLASRVLWKSLELESY